jgi:hypothetical protein
VYATASRYHPAPAGLLVAAELSVATWACDLHWVWLRALLLTPHNLRHQLLLFAAYHELGFSVE